MPSREGRYNIYLPELAEAVTVSLIQAKTEVESAIRPGRTGAVPSVTEPHTAIDPMEARVYNKDMLVVPCTAEATSEVREMIARSERFSNLDNAKIQVAGGAGSEEATLTSRARYYFAGAIGVPLNDLEQRHLDETPAETVARGAVTLDSMEWQSAELL